MTETGSAGIEWTEAGAPRSRRFDDVYFSERDGRAESLHVFFDGCGLPAAWTAARTEAQTALCPDRPRFTIAELGFGVGLNCALACALWRAGARPAGAELDYVAFEIAPPGHDEIRRALAPWPDLAAEAEQWRAGWTGAPGWRRRALGDGVALTLAVGDANALLPEWDGAADAWFLDGFSPAKNPELWGGELLRAVYARTAPGGAAATYAAAGWVRRNLEDAGFTVARRAGFRSKRHMTVARRG